MNAETLGTSRGTAVNELIVVEVVVVAVTMVTVAVTMVTVVVTMVTVAVTAVTVAGPQAHGVDDHQRVNTDGVAAAVIDLFVSDLLRV